MKNAKYLVGTWRLYAIQFSRWSGSICELKLCPATVNVIRKNGVNVIVVVGG